MNFVFYDKFNLIIQSISFVNSSLAIYMFLLYTISKRRQRHTHLLILFKLKLYEYHIIRLWKLFSYCNCEFMITGGTTPTVNFVLQEMYLDEINHI